MKSFEWRLNPKIYSKWKKSKQSLDVLKEQLLEAQFGYSYDDSKNYNDDHLDSKNCKLVWVPVPRNRKIPLVLIPDMDFKYLKRRVIPQILNTYSERNVVVTGLRF
jgi:hypothetical protein